MLLDEVHHARALGRVSLESADEDVAIAEEDTPGARAKVPVERADEDRPERVRLVENERLFGYGLDLDHWGAFGDCVREDRRSIRSWRVEQDSAAVAHVAVPEAAVELVWAVEEASEAGAEARGPFSVVDEGEERVALFVFWSLDYLFLVLLRQLRLCVCVELASAVGKVFLELSLVQVTVDVDVDSEAVAERFFPGSFVRGAVRAEKRPLFPELVFRGVDEGFFVVVAVAVAGVVLG